MDTNVKIRAMTIIIRDSDRSGRGGSSSKEAWRESERERKKTSSLCHQKEMSAYSRFVKYYWENEREQPFLWVNELTRV